MKRVVFLERKKGGGGGEGTASASDRLCQMKIVASREKERPCFYRERGREGETYPAAQPGHPCEKNERKRGEKRGRGKRELKKS